MDTYFAPAPRTERRKFINQIDSISHNPVMDTLLKTAAGLLVVLNQDRQIVAINHSFLKELGVKDIHEVLGFRLGEILHCVHAFKKPNGCGTTESCPSCGAAIAMMAAIEDDQISEQVCALLTDKKGDFSDTCLLIKAHPVKLGDNRWILIYAQDVTEQHFWMNLERIFFHDINNILTTIYGNAQLLELNQPGNDDVKSLRNGIERLVREVEMQKIFSQHKQAGIQVNMDDVPVNDIKKQTRLIISGHNSSYKKKLIEKWPEENISIRTDVLLVSRILGNMVINAFEASDINETVQLTTRIDPDHIAWEVWNKSEIPPVVQKRIFQRYFSTKPGKGRGLGTYSMKLFGEIYLKGQIFFNSSKEDGTCFTLRLAR